MKLNAKSKSILFYSYLMPLEFELWGEKIQEFNADDKDLAAKDIRLLHSLYNGWIGNIIPSKEAVPKKQNGASVSVKLAKVFSQDFSTSLTNLLIKGAESWSFKEIKLRNESMAKAIIENLIYYDDKK